MNNGEQKKGNDNRRRTSLFDLTKSKIVKLKDIGKQQTTAFAIEALKVYN